MFIATVASMPFYCSENKAGVKCRATPHIFFLLPQQLGSFFLPSKFWHQLEAISQSRKKFDKRNSFMKLNCTGVSDHNSLIHVELTHNTHSCTMLFFSQNTKKYTRKQKTITIK